MFECLSLYPLFPGTNEADQLDRIHKLLGTPAAELVGKFKSANGGAGSAHVDYDFAQVREPVGRPSDVATATATIAYAICQRASRHSSSPSLYGLFLQHKAVPGGLAKLLSHSTPEAVDLLSRLLAYDPGAY
jgi:hypothetical protein